MKLTESKLRSIIQEELKKLNEERTPYIDGREGDGTLDDRLDGKYVVKLMHKMEEEFAQKVSSELDIDIMSIESYEFDGDMTYNKFGNLIFAAWTDYAGAGCSLFKGDSLSNAESIMSWRFPKEPQKIFGKPNDHYYNPKKNHKWGMRYFRNQIMPDLMDLVKKHFRR